MSRRSRGSSGEKQAGKDEKERPEKRDDQAILDLTAHPVKLGSLDLAPDLQAIDLSYARLSHLENLEMCTRLEALVVRGNLISEIKSLDTLTTLEYLDMYDNQLDTITGLSTLVNLENLDLSFNGIRRIEGLPNPAPKLIELYFANNKIEKIDNLPHAPILNQLELGANRIRAIENLEHLTSLRSLWLGKNKITVIQGLSALTNLTKLSVQSNRLTSLGSGLVSLTNLQELYLSHNGITTMAGIGGLVQLNTLDMSNNSIAEFIELEKLTDLTELWMNHNRFDDWAQIDRLKHLKLETVYLEGNPIHMTLKTADKEDEYRQRLKAALPTLTQIDAELHLNMAAEAVASLSPGFVQARSVLVQELQQHLDETTAQIEAVNRNLETLHQMDARFDSVARTWRDFVDHVSGVRIAGVPSSPTSTIASSVAAADQADTNRS